MSRAFRLNPTVVVLKQHLLNQLYIPCASLNPTVVVLKH